MFIIIMLVNASAFYFIPNILSGIETNKDKWFVGAGIVYGVLQTILTVFLSPMILVWLSVLLASFDPGIIIFIFLPAAALLVSFSMSCLFLTLLNKSKINFTIKPMPVLLKTALFLTLVSIGQYYLYFYLWKAYCASQSVPNYGPRIENFK